MYMKKYGITFLMGSLCLAFTVITDILFGFPWTNFIINWKFTLFSIVEKWTVILLLILLFVPDVYQFFKKKKSRHASQS
ncbi:hypothetical protein PVOR_24986 [Paenibacillus vortex V453]|jgi:hypothetical protein|uniref:Uncharacterized protein n=2 Tax=Paenibacillus TaxID=44249 RepID=A0A2R9SPR4_9BACL|nr:MULTISPECIES: hypothetical protein [Paenibacillus]ANA78723.1 hypothetical protein A3958_01340 [Paenibacillus glucanolyticus]AVV57363.1 hypothetical protein C7121_15205 [Paenibacillus glucanolyticus]AWP26519.1 hypothetical protein B9D94_07795 [Paenibacillus sp. Cedars]EFU39377.1 hypothetical protein PVOR_24986 [Paenibacillus vortex V453]ETT35270.1 hypothetical protein C169_17165 [Paenibacillus sp. FSL R5-808]